MSDFDDERSSGQTRSFVQFRMEPVQDEAKSEAEGRPIFVDAEYIRILVPGDKTNVVDRPVRPSDKQQYRVAYQQWKAGEQKAGGQGTPLSEAPWMTRGQVKEMAHFEIHTVEQLAELSDGNAQNLGPVLSLRQKARDYIEHAKGHAPHQKMRAEVDKLANENAVLQRQLKELGDRFEQSQKAAKK